VLSSTNGYIGVCSSGFSRYVHALSTMVGVSMVSPVSDGVLECRLTWGESLVSFGVPPPWHSEPDVWM
jgi:hypothetical protein